jgi:excisionase family DNA binding protein
MPQEFSTFEAARTYGANPVTLQRLVAQGRLEATKDGNGRWRITRKSLDRWNKNRLARKQKSDANRNKDLTSA